MNATLSGLGRRTDRMLPWLAWLAALALVVWIAAVLFWRLMAPEAVSSSPHREHDPRQAAHDILQALGSSKAPQSAVVDVGYRLVAVATGFGALPAFAILETAAGQSFSLSEGEKTPDGLTLTHIGPEHVEFGGGKALRFDAPPPAPHSKD